MPPTNEQLSNWANGLDEPFRSYVRDLEANADPAGTLRENVVAREQIAALLASIGEKDAEIERLNKWADGMTDIALKERATGDAYQKELRATIERLKAACNWTCFHCDAQFTDEKEALAHFGPYHENVNSPACTRRHAKLYRWLRKHSWLDGDKGQIHFGVGCNQTKPEILDAAIEAAVDTAAIEELK